MGGIMRAHLRLAAATLPCCLLLTSIGAIAAAPASANSGYPPIPSGPILFGVSTSLTGAAASYGVPTVQSFQGVTLKAFNAKHPNGIDGHKLEIKIYNDNSTVTGAVQAAQQMASDHVAGVATLTTNPRGSSQQVAVLARNKVPIVSTLSGSQYSNTKKFPYAFSPASSVQQEGSAAGKWIGSHGFTRVAWLSDGVAQDTDALDQILAGIRRYAPKAKIVGSQTIPPGTVNASTAITALKATNPQLLVVFIGLGYGPVWQAMQTANWSPTVLASAGAWYDGFSAMGPLAAKAYSPYVDCAASPTQTFSIEQQALFAGYSSVTSGQSFNYLTYIASDSIPVELLAYAIEKYHSTDPNAIKRALEGIHNQLFLGIKYNFSPANHYGVTGGYAAAVCVMSSPYAGGLGKVPIRST
jgi:ABC-type branched-subunit amino acid transport system substrate-binding protein